MTTPDIPGGASTRPPLKQLHAKVRPHSHANYRHHAAAHGVTMSALIDAIGIELDVIHALMGSQLAETARAVEAQYRARR